MFLADFKKSYPDKKIDAQLAYYSKINLKAFSQAIKESIFLQSNNNLSLSWLLKNSDDIIAGKYKNYGENITEINFNGRKYKNGYLNSMFQTLDEIEI